MVMQLITAREFVRVAVQSARGTFAPSGSIWTTIPIEPGSFNAPGGAESLVDKGRRGVDAMDFGAYEGVSMSDISLSGSLRLKTAGGQQDRASDFVVFAANILTVDDNYVVLQSALPSVQAHGLQLGHTPSYLTIEHIIPGRTGQPPMYHRYSDCRVTELTLQASAAENFITYAVTLVGQDRELVGASAPTIGVTGPPIPGWRMTMDGTAAAFSGLEPRLMEAEWTFAREGTPFYAATSVQTFSDLHMAPLEVTCSLTFDFTDDAQLALYQAKTQGRVVTKFPQESGSDARRIVIGGELFDLADEKVSIDTSESAARMVLAGRGIYTTETVSNDLEGTGTRAVDIGDQDSPVVVMLYEQGGPLNVTRYNEDA